jgi:hypothetical protein
MCLNDSRPLIFSNVSERLPTPYLFYRAMNRALPKQEACPLFDRLETGQDSGDACAENRETPT